MRLVLVLVLGLLLLGGRVLALLLVVVEILPRWAPAWPAAAAATAAAAAAAVVAPETTALVGVVV